MSDCSSFVQPRPRSQSSTTPRRATSELSKPLSQPAAQPPRLQWGLRLLSPTQESVQQALFIVPVQRALFQSSEHSYSTTLIQRMSQPAATTTSVASQRYREIRNNNSTANTSTYLRMSFSVGNLFFSSWIIIGLHYNLLSKLLSWFMLSTTLVRLCVNLFRAC